MTKAALKKARARVKPRTSNGTPAVKWRPEFIERVRGAAFQGATQAEIAKMLGVAVTTLHRWAKGKPEFSKALNERDEADARVERSLYERAIGYEYIETTSEAECVAFNEDGEQVPVDSPFAYSSEIVMVPKKQVTKKEAPSTTAQIFWLKNRKPESWRDKSVVEHEDPQKRVAALQMGRKRIADARKKRESKES